MSTNQPTVIKVWWSVCKLVVLLGKQRPGKRVIIWWLNNKSSVKCCWSWSAQRGIKLSCRRIFRTQLWLRHIFGSQLDIVEVVNWNKGWSGVLKGIKIQNHIAPGFLRLLNSMFFWGWLKYYSVIGISFETTNYSENFNDNWTHPPFHSYRCAILRPTAGGQENRTKDSTGWRFVSYFAAISFVSCL